MHVLDRKKKKKKQVKKVIFKEFQCVIQLKYGKLARLSLVGQSGAQ